MAKRKNIDDVFTPRRSEVNLSMYVDRTTLEKRVKRSISKNIHSLLLGESGSGKSWLLKKVLNEDNVPFAVVSFAAAKIKGSVKDEICSVLAGAGTARKTSYKETKGVEGGAIFAKGKLAHEGHYEISQEDPLLSAFRKFRPRSKNKKKIIVLDNLERILHSPDLLEELGNLVMLLDDDRFSTHNINFIIVGTPIESLEYFRKTDFYESVSNRLERAAVVGSLNYNQTRALIIRGFEYLKVDFTRLQLVELAKHIHSVTLGIAQDIHEYCRELAYIIKDKNWNYDEMLLPLADSRYLDESFDPCYDILNRHLNLRKSEHNRRNQVIYTIGHSRHQEFSPAIIDKELRTHFPSKNHPKGLGVSSILHALASGKRPLIKVSNHSGSSYHMSDPKLLMLIRLLVKKEKSSNKVYRRYVGRWPKEET